MKSFADWIVGSVFRVGFLAAALTLVPMIGFSGSGVLVLASLKRGPGFGLTSGGVATATLLLMGLALGQGVEVAVGAVLLFWVPALGLAELLRRTGQLGPSLTMATIASMGVVLLWFGLVGNSDGSFTTELAEELRPLIQQGLTDATSEDQLLELLVMILPGLLAGSLMLIAVLGLLTGMWWHASINSPGALGDAFRSLRLGGLLGIVALGVVVAVAADGGVVFRNLLMVLVVAYLVQGIAVLHGIAHWRKWPSGALVAVYVLIVVGLGFMAPALAMVGLTDTWADFRGRARGAA
ncbi:MAG: DUF2232 domain-containing protein [Gammaproteobacteria bacterium]